VSSHPLNSDKLGEKGKKHFGEICADAKLECNASDYDRTGWDFIVEFPFPPVAGTTVSLEERDKPLSCHVQLKTLWESSDKISIRLSSAEHIAKELKPTFVYVFKVNSALEFTGAYLIHLIDGPLAKVLKRLRKEDIAGNTAPNKKTISMSASGDGLAIAPTGQALRDAILAACGPDLRAYADRKSNQIETLGFEDGRYQLAMSLSANSMEDIVDAFLGLKKDVPATNVKSSQTRFGLKKPIPEHSDGEAKISIQPTAFDSCTITVRSGPLASPAVFKGQVYRPAIPGLPVEQMKLLIDADLFQFTFQRSNWTISSTPPHPPHTFSEWIAYWRFAHILASGSGTIQIVADKAPINSTLNVTAKLSNYEPDHCYWLCDLCEKAAALLKLAGVTHEPKVSIEQVVDRAKQITSASLGANAALAFQCALMSSSITKSPKRTSTKSRNSATLNRPTISTLDAPDFALQPRVHLHISQSFRYVHVLAIAARCLAAHLAVQLRLQTHASKTLACRDFRQSRLFSSRALHISRLSCDPKARVAHLI